MVSPSYRTALTRTAAGTLGAFIVAGLAVGAPAEATAPTTAAGRIVAASTHKKITRSERNQRIAAPLVKKRWHLSAHQFNLQFRCLKKLWDHESGWNHRAHNPWSGAYGIPQALPGRKMRSAGRDWKTNPATQIKWGLSYIKGRYKTPCRAWRKFQHSGWY